MCPNFRANRISRTGNLCFWRASKGKPSPKSGQLTEFGHTPPCAVPSELGPHAPIGYSTHRSVFFLEGSKSHRK